MSELENAEVNRQLFAVAADEMFDSWFPETREQILAEWNDWRQDENPRHCCYHCEKVFTRSDNPKRHVCDVHKTFATKDRLYRHKKVHSKEKAFALSQEVWSDSV
jgi:hypothetical protein